MKILIIGCSNGLGLHHVIRDCLSKNRDEFLCMSGDPNDEIWRDQSDIYYNLSSGGAGNRYITNRLLEWTKVNGNPDYVYLQYSGLNRIDVSCSKTTVFANYNFQRRSEFSNWIHSGGMAGSWLNNSQTQKMFTNLYDAHDQTNIVIQNLFEINNAINFLSTEKIPFNWNTYYDYHKPPTPHTKADGMLDEITSEIYDNLDKTNKIQTSLINHITSTNSDWLEDDQVHYKYAGGMNWLSVVENEFILKKFYDKR